MEAKVFQSLQWSTLSSSENIVRRHGGPLHFKLRQSGKKWKNIQAIVSYDIGNRKGGNGPRSIVLKVPCSSQNVQGIYLLVLLTSFFIFPCLMMFLVSCFIVKISTHDFFPVSIKYILLPINI